MGVRISCKCKSCGYTSGADFGVGFLFPKVYSDTLKKMRKGYFGEFSKKFLVDNHEGAVNCELVALVCPKCNCLDSGYDLTMYVPKVGYKEKPNEGAWAVGFPFKGAIYVTSWDLKENYVEYAKYNHRCPKCDGNMKTLTENQFMRKLQAEKILCPKCGSAMEQSGELLWD